MLVSESRTSRLCRLIVMEAWLTKRTTTGYYHQGKKSTTSTNRRPSKKPASEAYNDTTLCLYMRLHMRDTVSKDLRLSQMAPEEAEEEGMLWGVCLTD